MELMVKFSYLGFYSISLIIFSVFSTLISSAFQMGNGEASVSYLST